VVDFKKMLADHRRLRRILAKENQMALKKFDLKKALAGANKKLGAAKEKAETGGFEEFDDGSYIMRCMGGELGQSNSSDRFQATMHWKFVEGDYAKKSYRSFQGLETEDGISFFLRDLSRLGYDVSGIENLNEVLPILKELKEEKPVCRVKLKTKGEYQNLIIVKLLEDEDVEDEDDDDDGEEEEAAPKKTKKKKPAKEEEEEEDEDGEDEDEEESDDEEESSDDEEEESDDDDAEESDDDEEESEDEEESDDEEVAVSVGSKVKMKTKAGIKKGTIEAVDEKNNKVTVKIGDRSLTLSAEKIVSVEDVPKAAAKKPAKKPVKKPAKKK
jgi:hypothetical protein